MCNPNPLLNPSVTQSSHIKLFLCPAPSSDTVVAVLVYLLTYIQLCEGGEKWRWRQHCHDFLMIPSPVITTSWNMTFFSFTASKVLVIILP